MTKRTLPTGPDPEAIARTILETWPETDMVSIDGASFFSLDPETHWPNYATIVWADNFDQSTNLSEPGVFRLNLGVSRATFQRIAAVGARSRLHGLRSSCSPTRCTRSSCGSRSSTRAKRRSATSSCP